MDTNITPDPWDGVELTALSEVKKAKASNGNNLPRRQQAIVDALEAGNIEDLRQSLSPSKVRSTSISQALGQNFSPAAADLLFEAGWINPSIVWRIVFDKKNWEGMSWWMRNPERVMALEEAVGIPNIRKFTTDKFGTKSLLGAGSVWEDVLNLAESSPQDFMDMVISADWKTLLRGGAYYNLPTLVVEGVLSVAIISQSDKKSALALERVFKENLSSFTKEHGDTDLPWSPEKNMFLLAPILTFISTQQPDEAARAQNIVNQSSLIRNMLAVLWRELSQGTNRNVSLEIFGRCELSEIARRRICLNDGSYQEERKVSPVSSIPRYRMDTNHTKTKLDGWLEYLIATASPSVMHAFSTSTSNPEIARLRKRVVGKIMKKPILLALLAENAPAESLVKAIPQMYIGLADINPKGSGFAHLIMAARPNVSIADTLSRLDPPVDLTTKLDPFGQTAVSFIDPTYQTASLIDRLKRNYARVSRKKLIQVSDSTRHSQSVKNHKPMM